MCPVECLGCQNSGWGGGNNCQIPDEQSGDVFNVLIIKRYGFVALLAQHLLQLITGADCV